jgi:hypothetical protein
MVEGTIFLTLAHLRSLAGARDADCHESKREVTRMAEGLVDPKEGEEA